MNNHSALTMAREDIWCCEGPLLETLPANWSGICTLVQLAVLFTLAFRHSDPSLKQTNHRAKRNALAPGGSFDPYIYIYIYIYSVGVPRGIPNESKARNQIAAGFESVLFWWSTINKNVDWINYIYYK